MTRDERKIIKKNKDCKIKRREFAIKQHSSHEVKIFKLLDI